MAQVFTGWMPLLAFSQQYHALKDTTVWRYLYPLTFLFCSINQCETLCCMLDDVRVATVVLWVSSAILLASWLTKHVSMPLLMETFIWHFSYVMPLDQKTSGTQCWNSLLHGPTLRYQSISVRQLTNKLHGVTYWSGDLSILLLPAVL